MQIKGQTERNKEEDLFFRLFLVCQTGRSGHPLNKMRDTKMKAFFIALATLSLNAFADEPADKWSLVYGRWGQAPLYGHGLKVTDEYVYVYEYASEIFPEGDVICTLPYRKHEVYKAYTLFSIRSLIHDVFVLELSDSCKWDRKGNVLIMAIPEKHRDHARISTLMKLDDLPKERPHTTHEPSYAPPKAKWSSGYGIRCRLDECGKYESHEGWENRAD